MADRPDRPTNESAVELGFTRVERMTPWLSPRQLLATNRRVKMATTFGAYSDKREVEAGLDALPPHRYIETPEVWVDFVADLGDAFGPTYTIACLLARSRLDLSLSGGQGYPTRRGQVLVMGGDQVYPTASRDGYRNQTLGPYRAALPYVADDPPHLYAIPGNHDWYDGLTAFLRVFCTRRRWVGGWCTQQSRSYFALQLPHRWWLWGIDTGLDDSIDEPQFRYFDDTVGRQMAPGDSVILCTPAPTWVKSHLEGRAGAYTTVDYLERKVIRAHDAEVRLTLTGDLHHYARYVRTDGPTSASPAQKVTSGGGGAFLAATHHLPEKLTLPHPESPDPGKSSPPTEWRLVKTYPSRQESRRVRWRVALLPIQNRGMASALGLVYLAYAWMAQAALRSGAEGFSEPIANMSYGDAVRALGRSPLAILVTLALVVGLAGFTKATAPAKKWGLGLAHAGAHLVAIVVVVEVVAAFCGRGLDLDRAAFAVAFVVLVGVVGGLIGSWVLAAYLLVADGVFGLNDNELFAAQRNRDRKSFLRLHLDEDGVVTVYPVGVDRTPRRWRVRPEGTDGDPWFEPEDGPVTAHLIEEPIMVAPAARPADEPPAGV
jgi:3',5'-cyclic AMP phosphodiesterase CpdA